MKLKKLMKTNSPKLTLNNPETLAKLHFATLDILQDTGILIEDGPAADIFFQAGASVVKEEERGWRVRISSSLVEQSLKALPRQVTLYGRIPQNDVHLGGKPTYAFFGEGTKIIDINSRKVRASNKKDCGQTALFCDYFDDLKIMERSLASGDAPAEIYPLHNAHAIFRNTSKHACIGALTGKNVDTMIQMAKCCLEDGEFKKRPFLSFSACPTSPLILGKFCCETILHGALQGAPIAIISMALSGASAPLSPAATVVQHNAEVLSAVTLVQLVNSGNCCIYGSCSCPINLKTGSVNLSSPEGFFINQCLTELAASYHMPSWIGVGFSANSKLEQRSCYEYGIYASLATMGGADIILGTAGLDGGMTFDYAKAVMDIEVNRMLNHIKQGMDISDESIAKEVIVQAGPGANFLMNPHTIANLSKIFNTGSVFFKTSKDALDLAYEKAKQVLDSHKPAPLPKGADDKMLEIIESCT